MNEREAMDFIETTFELLVPELPCEKVVSVLYTALDDLETYKRGEMPAVSVVLVIKAGVLEVSKVFADESAADEFYEAMRVEYDIDPLSPDSSAEDVLHLREEVVLA